MSFTSLCSTTRPRPIGCDLGDCLALLSSPGQNASLRPVLFYCYCYFVFCDRLIASACRDLVACLPDCLAGLFTRVPACHPSGRSCHLGSSRPSLGHLFFTHHTFTPPSDCYVVFTIQLNCFGFTNAFLTHSLIWFASSSIVPHHLRVFPTTLLYV